MIFYIYIWLIFEKKVYKFLINNRSIIYQVDNKEILDNKLIDLPIYLLDNNLIILIFKLAKKFEFEKVAIKSK